MKGETIHDKQDIVNSFNEHFVNLFNLISQSSFNPESFSHLKQHLDVLVKGRAFNIDIYISVFEVKLLIDKLDPSKPAGLDFIGPRVLILYGDTNTLYSSLDQ